MDTTTPPNTARALITFSDYAQLAQRTIKWMPDIKWDLAHAAMGLGREPGELVEAQLNYYYATTTTPGAIAAATMRKDSVEEIGDQFWFNVHAFLVVQRLNGLDAVPQDEKWTDMLAIPAESNTKFWPIYDGVQRVHGGLVPSSAYMAMAHAAASEFVSLAKAYLIYGKPITTGEFFDALAAHAFFLERSLEASKITFDEVAHHNINDKLRKRYPDKYADEFAIARLDKEPHV